MIASETRGQPIASIIHFTAYRSTSSLCICKCVKCKLKACHSWDWTYIPTKNCNHIKLYTLHYVHCMYIYTDISARKKLDDPNLSAHAKCLHYKTSTHVHMNFIAASLPVLTATMYTKHVTCPSSFHFGPVLELLLNLLLLSAILYMCGERGACTKWFLITGNIAHNGYCTTFPRHSGGCLVAWKQVQ